MITVKNMLRRPAKALLIFFSRIVNACFFRLYLKLGKSYPERVKNPLVSLPGKAILVLAPHIDDDAIGCGGAILEYSSRRVSVHVAYLTAGQLHGTPGLTEDEVVAERVEEARRAAAIMGIQPANLHFLGARDGNLLETEIHTNLGKLVGELRPDTIFLPCLLDTHVDHYAATVKLYDVFRGNPELFRTCTIVLYESQSPLTPFYANVALDISRWCSEKWRLLRVYRSQGNLGFAKELNGVNALIAKGSIATELFVRVAAEKYFLWYEHRYRDCGNYFEIRDKLIANGDSRSLIRSFMSSRNEKTSLLELPAD